MFKKKVLWANTDVSMTTSSIKICGCIKAPWHQPLSDVRGGNYTSPNLSLHQAVNMLYNVIKQDILPQESDSSSHWRNFTPTLSPRFDDHVDSYFYICTCVLLISWCFKCEFILYLLWCSQVIEQQEKGQDQDHIHRNPFHSFKHVCRVQSKSV